MFNERLRHALHQGTRYSRGIAVMFIDIDRFKVVNDSLGPQRRGPPASGQRQRLTECLRESDTVGTPSG